MVPENHEQIKTILVKSLITSASVYEPEDQRYL